jgi:hypothetical protein
MSIVHQSYVFNGLTPTSFVEVSALRAAIACGWLLQTCLAKKTLVAHYGHCNIADVFASLLRTIVFAAPATSPDAQAHAMTYMDSLQT